jgi:integrase
MFTISNVNSVGMTGFSSEGLQEFILQQKINDVTIMLYVDELFEKITSKILESGAGWGFSWKGDEMTLYKRERSRYFYVDINYNNLRIRRTTKCEDKRSAEMVKLCLTLKMMNVLPVSNQNLVYPMEPQEKPKPFFQEVSQQYLEEKASTLKSHKREVLCHTNVVKYFGKMRIDKIEPQDIHAFIQKERKRKVRGGKTISATSINYNRGYLHRLFEFAVNVLGLVDVNPVKKISPLPQDNMRDRVLLLEEERKLLPCIEKEWLKDIVKFTILTGLRISEVAGLRKSNFFVDEKIPYFKLKREKANISTEFPIVFLELEGIINKYLYATKGDIFFCDESGKQINSDKIYNHYKKAVKKAGLQDLNFHDLRRTFFSRIRLGGCNPTVAEYLMGHKQKELVARYLSYDLRSIAVELKKIEGMEDIYVTHTSHFDKNRG